MDTVLIQWWSHLMYYEGISNTLFLAYGLQSVTINCTQISPAFIKGHMRRPFSSKAVNNRRNGKWKATQSVNTSLPAAAAPPTSAVTAGFYVNAFFKLCVTNKEEERLQTGALVQQILFLSGGALRVSSRRVLRVNESTAVKISFCRCWRRAMEEATKKGR